MDFNGDAIVSVKRSDYRIHFCYMSKNYAIRIMSNSNLNEKWGVLNFLLLLLCITMSEKMYYQKTETWY